MYDERYEPTFRQFTKFACAYFAWFVLCSIIGVTVYLPIVEWVTSLF